jgi:hypothetical protein
MNDISSSNSVVALLQKQVESLIQERDVNRIELLKLKKHNNQIM